MTPIAGTLFQFNQALEQQLPITADANGNWGEGYHWYQFLVRIFRGDAFLTDPLITAFNKAADRLEYYHSEDIQLYLKTAQSLRQFCKSSSILWKLDQRIYALQARSRLGQRPVRQELDVEFLGEVCRWKYNQTYSPNGALNPKQVQLLTDAMKHPEFVALVRKNVRLREQFLNWTIRDQCNPEIFILYPHLAERMTEVKLSARVGFDNLIRMNGKSLFLKCEKGRELNLRDVKATVALKHGFRFTFDDICKRFEERAVKFGDLDTNEQGLINWSPGEFGPYDPASKTYRRINFNSVRWWEQLPIEEVLTPVEMQRRFRLQKPPKRSSWYFSVLATSQTNRELRGGNTHGCLVVCIPHKGSYRLYSFGKYTFDDFPVTLSQLLRVILQAVPARIVSPDGSARESCRDKEYLTVQMTEEEGVRRLEEVKADIQLGFRGLIPFQLFSTNCMDWALEKIKDKLDRKSYDACYIKPFDADVNGVLRVAFTIYNLLPRIFTRIVLNSFSWFFGGYTELKVKTRDGITKIRRFVDHSPWHPVNNRTVNPSWMLRLRREGRI